MRCHSQIFTLGGVMMGAAALVSHAYLPAWIFDRMAPADRAVPFLLFLAWTVVGLACVTLIRGTDRLLENSGTVSLKWRAFLYLAVILACNAVLVGLVFPAAFRLIMGRDPRSLAGLWIMTSIVGIVVSFCHLIARAAATQRERTLHLQLETDRLATALDHAELAMLEAQIEPHFLFNTLAHIKRQYRLDAATADEMMSALVDYLDRAVPALHRTEWTVGDELDLIRVYLGLLKQRFGERLHFDITAPLEARQIRLPALTITTLVENAVRHGLAPKAEGGFVSVNAELDNAGLKVEVCDDGVGLRQSSGSGLGLATVRARLRSAFGTASALLVEPRQEGGVRASIQLPLKAGEAWHAHHV